MDCCCLLHIHQFVDMHLLVTFAGLGRATIDSPVGYRVIIDSPEITSLVFQPVGYIKVFFYMLKCRKLGLSLKVIVKQFNHFLAMLATAVESKLSKVWY